MSCMSPQFIYQLQLNYYCHSLLVLNLSLMPLDISSLQKLFDSLLSTLSTLHKPGNYFCGTL